MAEADAFCTPVSSPVARACPPAPKVPRLRLPDLADGLAYRSPFLPIDQVASADTPASQPLLELLASLQFASCMRPGMLSVSSVGPERSAVPGLEASPSGSVIAPMLEHHCFEQALAQGPSWLQPHAQLVEQPCTPPASPCGARHLLSDTSSCSGSSCDMCMQPHHLELPRPAFASWPVEGFNTAANSSFGGMSSPRFLAPSEQQPADSSPDWIEQWLAAADCHGSAVASSDGSGPAAATAMALCAARPSGCIKP